MSLHTARAQQKSFTAGQEQVIDTVSTIFTAARADDLAKFDSVIGPGFYIFDGGARFNGDSIMALIKSQHAAGKRYEWNVPEPDVHISGNMPLRPIPRLDRPISPKLGQKSHISAFRTEMTVACSSCPQTVISLGARPLSPYGMVSNYRNGWFLLIFGFSKNVRSLL
jgi:hypothetical protein